MGLAYINKGSSISVRGVNGSTSREGVIGRNELFYYHSGDTAGGMNIYFFDASSGWVSGHVYRVDRNPEIYNAYDSRFAYGKSLVYGYYKFPVTRQCRIWRVSGGERVQIDTIQAGGHVLANGYSNTDFSLEPKLHIEGYNYGSGADIYPSGTIVCDLDFDHGYVMYNNATVDGKWV